MNGPMVAKFQFRAGVLVRRQARAHAAVLGLTVQEFRGWFDSWFVVSGDHDKVRLMYEWVSGSQERAIETLRAMRRQEKWLEDNPNGPPYAADLHNKTHPLPNDTTAP